MIDQEFKVVRVTKLDCARHQLKSAIWLWFAESDPVSALTLAYAAHEIIHRLYRRQGLSDLLFDSTSIKEEHRSEFNNMLKEWPNFIKHANRDDEADDYTDLNSGACLLFIIMACIGLERMGHKHNESESAFMYWLAIHMPSWFTEDRLSNRIPPERLAETRALSKQEFFQTHIPILAEMKRRGVF